MWSIMWNCTDNVTFWNRYWETRVMPSCVVSVHMTCIGLHLLFEQHTVITSVHTHFQYIKSPKYSVRIKYRRILQNHIFTNTEQKHMMLLPVESPITSKDTTRIARAHQHRNRERHTRHAWEGLTGMGVSPGHLPCHTWGAHRMHLRSLRNCKHSSFRW